MQPITLSRSIPRCRAGSKYEARNVSAIPCMAAGAVQERELRAEVRALRKKSTSLALAILAADLFLYGALTWGAIAYRSWILGTLAGAAIAMLFVVGHDACHG